MNARAHNSALR